MNIAFGGSFNPITIAHQDIINYVTELYNPTYFIIIIAGKTYYKSYDTSYDDRKEMMKLVLNDKRIIYSDIEKDQFNGTVHTLNILKERYDDLRFLLGADQFIKLPSWIGYEALIKSNKFIVLDRDDILNDELINLVTKQHRSNFSFLKYNNKVSSTKFREDKIKDMVDEKVYEYILEHKLYK